MVTEIKAPGERVMATPCPVPVCQATAYVRCRTNYGLPRMEPHRARVRAAEEGTTDEATT